MSSSVQAAPSTYQTRHEVVNEVDSLAHEMAEDASSHVSSGSQYLQEVLGDVLAEALSKVAKERPADPIQYVANHLHSLNIKAPRMDSPEKNEDNDEEPNSSPEPNVVNAEEVTSGHQSRLDVGLPDSFFREL